MFGMTEISKWFYPVIPKSGKNLINNVINSGFINEGAVSEKFKSKINKITKRKFSSVTPNGTAAITLGLMALGVKKNDLVGVPGFTYIATVNAVSILGAKPIFIDISKILFLSI